MIDAWLAGWPWSRHFAGNAPAWKTLKMCPRHQCIWCIWLVHLVHLAGASQMHQMHWAMAWPHARQPKEQARDWHCIAHFHHTTAHPIYWEDHFASCAWTQALPVGDLDSACQDGCKCGSFDAI